MVREVIPGRPVYWSRQYIEPFTWDEDEMWEVIKARQFAAVSWVTKENGPVTALMAYLWLHPDGRSGRQMQPGEREGNIWITSTTNRHKFQAWKRNPQACLCIWPADNTGKQATLRGRVELFSGKEHPDLHRRWIATLVDSNDQNRDPDERARQISLFDSPNRWYMKFTIERIRTYDGSKMRQAEEEGIDVWGEGWDFPQGH
jgi:general stress protein 26